jgi:hypothetical protein
MKDCCCKFAFERAFNKLSRRPRRKKAIYPRLTGNMIRPRKDWKNCGQRPMN